MPITPLKYLDFEKDIESLDEQIKEMEKLKSVKGINYSFDIRKLHTQRTSLLKKIYNQLSPWQIVQIARHPQRPLLFDYI